MKKRFLTMLMCVVFAPGFLLAQVGPGLGNLTYPQSDLYKAIWKYTEVNHYGSNIATMHNGYLVTTFTPDSGKPPGGILVWDVSNPRRPIQVARIYDSRTSTFREQHALPQHDKYILMQDGCGFQIWDFSDPRNPKQTKRHCMTGYAHDDYGSTWQMFWQAPYIFIANGSRGFDVVDATDINNPQFVKHITTPRQIGSIYAIGNLLVTSAHDFGKGITIYDISNPRDPRLLNSFSNTENMYASMVNGNKLVISARGNANNAIFGTYDISDPLNIRKLGTLNIGNSGEQLYNSMQDQFIFQGCQSEVVKINASNLNQLTIEGRGSLGINGDSDHGQVSPFGNLIFVGNDHGSGSGFWVHQTQPDKKGPDVNMISPRSNEVNRALTSRIGITLTDHIQIESVNKNTFIVRPVGGAALSGKYSHQFAIVNFSPDQPLLPNTTYEVIIPAGGIKDYAGNTSTQTFTSYFSTGPTGNFPPGTAGTPWVFEDDKQVTLNWDRISNSTGSVIKRSTSPTGPFQTIGTTTQLSYIDRNLTNETTYYYQIVGENSFGQGVASVAVRAKPAFYITSLNYTSQTNGWGPAEIDQSNGEAAANDGNVITLNGVEYSRGLGVHAQSTIKYNLDGKYDRFLSDVGVDDEVGNIGSVVFTVSLDGVQIYTSGLMNGTTATKAINVSVAGGRELTLTVTQDADNGGDHASWGGARLIPVVNQAPSIVITGPAANSTFTTLETITLTATATDTDGSISNVEFYNGTTKLGEDATAPYSYSWTNVAVGTYTITAIATDNSGNKKTSAPVTIKVNVPQGPYNGTAHIIPGTIEFESYDVGGNGFAYLDNSPGSLVTPVVNFRTDEDVDIETCTDAGGGYNIGFTTAGEWLEYTVNVQATGIYAMDLRVACLGNGRTISVSMDGTNIASNVAIPNTTGWQTWQTIRLNNISLTVGQKIMRMTVGATDFVNLNYVTFTLVPPPVATITATGATAFCAGGSVVLNAGTGTGYTYQWKRDGNNIANATTSSYTATQSGSYTVTISANSQTVTSTAVAVTVNALPVVTISSSGPTTFVQGGSVTLQANTGAGLSYKWFNGTSQIATGSTYVAIATGSYTVEVTNASNCKATPSSINVTANQNQPSVITINSPVANSTVSGPITIEATVSDPDGAIAKVEYLAGTTLLGTSTSSPYNFIWQTPISGNHEITVRVTDSNGGITTSSPITIISGTITGIHPSTEIQITVYPNPSYKEITLETEMDLTNAKITVINVLGQEIQLPSTVNVNGANIDVSSLTEGTYLLIVRQENNVMKRKISIVK